MPTFAKTATAPIGPMEIAVANDLFLLDEGSNKTITTSNSKLAGELRNCPFVEDVALRSKYAAAIIADNPTAYWRFSEKPDGKLTSGRYAGDYMHRNPGKYHGGVVLGQSGAPLNDPDPSVSLPAATDSFVAIPDSPDLHPSTFSIEAWVNFGSNPFTRGIFQNAINMPSYGFSLLTYAGNAFISINGNSNNLCPSYGNILVPTWNWVHLVGTYDGSALRIYQNNAKYTGPTINVAVDTATASFGQIGASSSWGYADGWVDEVALYPYALSDAQVANHYTLGTS